MMTPAPGPRPETTAPPLSICMFTAEPPTAVAVVLAPLRDLADEILVAVDSRVPADTLGPLHDIADRVIHTTFTWPLEANLAWLHDQCRNDWVLRIDGDEVLSQALIARLGREGWDDDVSHVYLLRRWLWNSPDQALDQSPWWPDPQLRLIRRGMARFQRGVHQLPLVAGDWRTLEEPLYHLNLLLANEHTRLEQAMRYEQARPGSRIDSGASQNVGFYVPERWGAALRTRPLPPADTVTIRSVLLATQLAADAGPALPSGTEVVDAAAEIVAESGPTVPQPGEAHVELFDAGPPEWMSAAGVTITVRIENRASTTWEVHEDPPLHVGARLYGVDGKQVDGEFRSDLTCPVVPGRSELVAMAISPTPPPGTYTLEVGVVREWIGWYDSLARHEVTVGGQRRVLFASGISRHRHLGDDLILRSLLDAVAVHHLEAEPVILSSDPGDARHRFGVRAEADASALVHRDARGTPWALRRLISLRRDARRVAAGGHAADPSNAPLIALIASSDVLVVAGAGWMTSAYRHAQLLPRTAEIEVARALGVPVMFEAGTIGPLTGTIDRILGHRMLRAMHRITVRDGAGSMSTARDLRAGGGSIVAVPDAATLLPEAVPGSTERWLTSAGHDPATPWAVVSCRAEDTSVAREATAATLVDEVATAVETLAERGIASVFLPHCVDLAADDRPVGRRVAEQAPLAVPEDMPPDAVAVAVIAGASVVLGNRFHLAVVADAAGVPGVLIAETAFDRQRAGALRGRNIATVLPGQVAGAIDAAVERGAGQRAPAWDPLIFAESVRTVLRR